VSASGPLIVRFQRLEHARDLPLPASASSGSSGNDLRAALASAATIEPGHRLLVPTGIAIELMPGWEGQVRPRSGLAREHGVTVLNAPGTIDADYRGEVCVLLVNLGSAPYTVRRGDRIAQIVFARVAAAAWQEVERLSSSGRGAGGFGSSGTS
jgi:dUTP pyrophosphatase